MRISSNTFPTRLLDQLGNLSSRQVQLQKQVSTGQRLEKPSDDPAAAARIRDMQTEQRESVTLRRNFDRAETTLNFTSNSTQLLHDLSRLALDAIGLLTGADSQEELNKVASQVNDVLEQASAVTQEQLNNQYVFAADLAGTPPYQFTRDPLTNRITAVAYVGGTGQMTYPVGAGVELSPTTSGTQNGEIRDWMEQLVQLRDFLEAGDRANISATAQVLDQSEDNLLVTVADLGSKAVRLEFVNKAEATRFNSLENEISREADVDLAQAVVQLNLTQSAYEAALKSAGSIMNLSLLDFV